MGNALLSLSEEVSAVVFDALSLEFRLNKGKSLLCTEGAVHEVTDIRVRHSEAPYLVSGFFSRPLRGLWNSINAAASQQ